MYAFAHPLGERPLLTPHVPTFTHLLAAIQAACHGLKWTVYSCWQHGLPAHLDLAPSEQLLTALGANEVRGWLIPRWSHYATGDDVGRAAGSPPDTSSVWKRYGANNHLAAYIAHQFTPSC